MGNRFHVVRAPGDPRPTDRICPDDEPDHPRAIQYPADPEEGDEFAYIDRIGGATWIEVVFRNGRWEYVRTA